MRIAIFAAALLFGAAILAACSDTTSESDCYEPNGVAYPVRAPNDSTVTFRWPSSYFPVRFWAEPAGNTVANTDAAMQLWLNGLRCGEVQLTRITDSVLADVLVLNPSVIPPPSAPAMATHVLFADTTNGCRGRTDILLDSVTGKVERPIHVWIAPFSTDSALLNACYRFTTSHEIGHALGLLFHSPDSNDIMFNRPRRNQLSANDKYTFQLLYHVVNPTLLPEPR